MNHDHPVIGPSAAGPSAAGPSAAGPSAAGPSAAGPSAAGSRRRLPRRVQSLLQERYGAAAEVLRRVLSVPVDVVVIAGSGMGTLLQDCAEPVLSYSELPGLSLPTVAGHTGVVRRAVVGGRTLLLMAGRRHLYEGASMQEIVALPALAALLGARAVLLLNSAGGLHPGWRTGDIMLIADSINMTFRTARRDWLLATPLAYRHPPSFFDADWRRAVAQELTRRHIAFREGTYLGVAGPSYETPAEVRLFRHLGGHAIGMSTVHEAEFAHFCGLMTAGCSLISNVLHEVAPPALSHHDVLDAARAGRPALEAWIRACCAALDSIPAAEGAGGC